ncbi:hypothetical protein E2C01_086262 [Portunus trituberculatus]|uniref:Uncharacterized protein n=1 Tax=Portunus trituberculatus TaxID=210409 RepID=A0A5B7JE39_PORTR|nr:hypothetical protein [Portunus trituberculatus]
MKERVTLNLTLATAASNGCVPPFPVGGSLAASRATRQAVTTAVCWRIEGLCKSSNCSLWSQAQHSYSFLALPRIALTAPSGLYHQQDDRNTGKYTHK